MMLYVVAALLLLAVVYFFNKQSAAVEVFTRFGLQESAYRVLSTDLGGSAGRIKLSRHGINGIADAVFEALKIKEIVVGEFKSRKYRHRVRLSEFYQLQLYLGHLKALYPNHNIRGVLAYADGMVSVAFDPAVYAALVAMRSEYWDTVKRRVASTPPLHKRIKVNTMNRGLTLVAEM